MACVNPELSRKRSLAGRIGGITNYMRRGSEGMSAIGKLGGRPCALNINDIRVTQSLAAENKKEKGGMDSPLILTSSLAALKRLWNTKGGGADGQRAHASPEGAES
jgi:hypothetical protein